LVGQANTIVAAVEKVDITTYNPNVVGEYIKLYYKDQAPLITMDQFEPEQAYNGMMRDVRCIANGKSVGINNTRLVCCGGCDDTDLTDYEQQAQFLQNLVQSLPDRNRQLLQVLVWLLANIAWSGEVNKMSSSLLAAIFAPYLLRPTALEYKTPQKVKLKSKLVF
jgi:hypothetical protein